MSTASSEPRFAGGGRERGLTVKRHPKARGLRLRVDPRNGQVLLTMPMRGSLRHARRWAEGQREWIEAELDALPAPRPILAGGTIPWRGEETAVEWRPGLPRRPRAAGGRIEIGGTESELANRVLRWMKAEARRIFEEETRTCAERAGLTVGRISVGDPRTRWGSCSASGAIRYSWRLAMAPPRVLSATVAHEVAHRAHMNHSPAFHALAAELFGADPAPERRWLARHGAALYWVGRSS